ncbi:MAG TPA: PmoA family protein [Acidimicrobiales bacterium]|nr:PmoA family protein [Acidimicrobiales bacterium]
MAVSDEGTVTVAVGDGGWTYHHGARKRPFLDPVRTPAGRLVTRDAPEDHPWHHGLWFTIKFVNGENFWEEYDAYGVLRHQGEPTFDGTTVRGTLHWIRPDRETVAVVEDRTWVHVPIDDTAYAIDLDTTLVPQVDTTFDRTPFTTWGGYGGLSLRGPGDWSETRLLLDDGREQERVLGDPGAWCDLSSADRGVTLLDHPDNIRHPTPWYGSTRAATYGDEGWSNFLNAAFLFHQPLEVAAGDGLRLRHRVVVHDGVWDHDRVTEAYEAWTS